MFWSILILLTPVAQLNHHFVEQLCFAKVLSASSPHNVKTDRANKHGIFLLEPASKVSCVLNVQTHWGEKEKKDRGVQTTCKCKGWTSPRQVQAKDKCEKEVHTRNSVCLYFGHCKICSPLNLVCVCVSVCVCV